MIVGRTESVDDHSSAGCLVGVGGMNFASNSGGANADTGVAVLVKTVMLSGM